MFLHLDVKDGPEAGEVQGGLEKGGSSGQNLLKKLQDT
jgi:hypothetical protein